MPLLLQQQPATYRLFDQQPTKADKTMNYKVKYYKDFSQKSGQWAQARCGKITASRVKDYLTPVKRQYGNGAKTLAQTLAAERITGQSIDITTPAMERGIADEELARAMYHQHYQPVEQVGFAERVVDGVTIGCSPDGLVGDDGGIEIKSHLPKIHLGIVLNDGPFPSEYLQIQASLLVTGRAWWDYVAYCEGMHLYVKRIYPDDKAFEDITTGAVKLEEEIIGFVEQYRTITEQNGLKYIKPVEELEI